MGTEVQGHTEGHRFPILIYVDNEEIDIKDFLLVHLSIQMGTAAKKSEDCNLEGEL